MITREQVTTLYGREVYDSDGNKVGTVGQVWGDATEGVPTWASVRTGWFGMNESLVPLQDAHLDGQRLRVPFDKSRIKDAPNIDVDQNEPLTPDEVEKLYQYYGLSGSDGYRIGASHTEDAMTRSEEQLNVGIQRAEVGKARLRKYVVTEQQQASVPVTHDEVSVQREPITDVNIDEAMSGPDIRESEHEVTLHAQRPTVQKETVPVERVRLAKQSVTEQQNVSGDVRKEQIDAELPDQGRSSLG